MTFVSSSGSIPVGDSTPVFDYSSRDYAAVFQDLLNRIPVYMPEWTSQSPNDFGIVLLQMFSYTVDLIGYYLDRLAGEAFIQTATQAASIINLAAMLDYQPTLSVGASVTLQITISSTATGPVFIPAGSQFSTVGSSTQPPVVFETIEDLIIAGANAATPSVTGQVLATQGVTYSNEAVATSDGTVNQSYPLLHSPVLADSYAVSVDLGLGPEVWTYTQSLINYGPYDHVYTTFVDANGVFYIVFGDGVNGYVPPLGSPVTATYQTGVGELGNVGAGSITISVGAIIGLISVTNAAAANGGTGPESLLSIQKNAPASLKALNRAVTVSDLEALAIQVSGIEWASAQEQTYQIVNLYCAPYGGGQLTANLQSAVENYVNPLVMANTTVNVLSPTYVEINITASVVAYDNYSNSSTDAIVTAALQNLLAVSNTGFGFRVSLGLVYQAILTQLGVNYGFVTALNRAVLTTLTTGLTNGQTGVTSLAVSALPQGIASGDSLVLQNAAGATQTVVAAAPANAGDLSITVTSFTANAAYSIGSTVQDVTAVGDCVLLENEIPIAGTISISVSGGLIGS